GIERTIAAYDTAMRYLEAGAARDPEWAQWDRHRILIRSSVALNRAAERQDGESARFLERALDAARAAFALARGDTKLHEFTPGDARQLARLLFFAGKPAEIAPYIDEVPLEARADVLRVAACDSANRGELERARNQLGKAKLTVES